MVEAVVGGGVVVKGDRVVKVEVVTAAVKDSTVRF